MCLMPLVNSVESFRGVGDGAAGEEGMCGEEPRVLHATSEHWTLRQKLIYAG